jgi:hypothetical protein
MVVDAVPLLPSPLAPVEWHVHPVPLGPLIGIDYHGRYVVLQPRGGGEGRLRRKRDGGGGVVAKMQRRWRADELEPTLPSFFVFFSHDVIFLERLWRCGNGGSASWCVRHRWPQGRLKKPWLATTHAGTSTFAINTDVEAQASSRLSALILMALRAAAVGQCRHHLGCCHAGMRSTRVFARVHADASVTQF